MQIIRSRYEYRRPWLDAYIKSPTGWTFDAGDPDLAPLPPGPAPTPHDGHSGRQQCQPW